MHEPKISVIIPLYNAEKYIRQCLISVLASKFKDYEVLVVDDCSTDNSVAEVKKILPHFEGRLKLFSTEKNSGGAGIPRNVGIQNAAGEYVTFIDNDDMIVPTALGYFALFADMYDADVVYSEKYFVTITDEFDAQNLKLRFCVDREELITTPILEPADLRTRIERDLAKKFFILPWGKCYRRNFLLENKIDFPQLRYAEDLTFCFKCLCLAKNYLRIPHITNIQRGLADSTSRITVHSPNDGLKPWLKILFMNMSILHEFMNGIEFFKANPDYRCDVFKYYIDIHYKIIEDLFPGFAIHEVQKIFYDELQNPELNPNGKNIVAAYFYAERVLKK